MADVIRIVMVDDHEMVLTGLSAMLSHFPDDIEIAGAATSVEEAVRLVARELPSVLLSDIRIGRQSGLDLCKQIKGTHPQVHVVFLSVYEDEQYLYQALRVGASGYVLKRLDAKELIAHLRRVLDGDIVIDPSMAGRVAISAARLNSGEFWPGAHMGLTQRESEVLSFIVAGHSNKAIAAKLVVSEDTVKTHIRGLYRKLGAVDRGAAIAAALREGLFQ